MAAIYKHILLASGGAGHSRAAEARAVELALAFSARLSLVSVARYSLPITTVGVGLDMGIPLPTDDYIDDLKAQQQEILDEALKRCKDHGLEPEGILLAGNAGERILEKAKELACDVIVVGSRKMSLFDTVIKGSVSDYVMRYAHCDVLIVHAKEA